jgi:hypothetical protein
MIPTIDEILEQRIKSEEEERNIESQWAVDEIGFNARASQLQKQRWDIESLEGQNHRLMDETYRVKNEKIQVIRSMLKNQEDLFKKQITLASLKHAIPTMDEFQREDNRWSPDSLQEKIVYDTPLVKIFALFGTGNKPINKVEYTLKIFAHEPLRRAINSEMIREKNHGKYYFSPEDNLLIIQKSFKTLEDAERYHERNYPKLIQEYVPQIDQFNSKVQSASDNLESIFDFRLIKEDTLRGYYARSTDYKIESKEKNKMVISWDNTKYGAEDDKGKFNVVLSGWQIFVDPANETTNSPDAIQLRGILGTLIYNEFNLSHLYDYMRDISSAADEQEKREQHKEWIAKLAEKSTGDLENYLTHVNDPDGIRKEVEEYKRRMV